MRILAGKYYIERELGSGSYGKVLLVRHKDLGVRFAMKILSPQFNTDPGFIERFKREAEILSKFNHPGSSQLRDFGQADDGRYYMVVDYCDGVLLQDLLSRGKALPVRRTTAIIAQILDVLAAAHSVGIVHRDIKPANVMIFTDSLGKDTVKVLDFGIAKLKESMQQDPAATMEGYALGTPTYMSPEQAAGESNLDGRADIYSTGIMMYEMLVGIPPFEGDTVLQILLKHLTQPPPPFPRNRGIPASLESCVMKAIEKDRTRRFNSAAEFKSACVASLNSTQKEPVNSATNQAALKDKRGTTILCLDDNEMILNIMTHLLDKEGYKVLTATNFSAIHDFIFKDGVDLLLCDVEMPGISGTTVCKMLKQAKKDLHVILFSNLPERDLEKLSVECRADSWISKNSKPGEWMSRIRDHLKKSST